MAIPDAGGPTYDSKGTRAKACEMILLKVWVTGLAILCGIGAVKGETIVLPSVYGTLRDFDMSGEKDGVADAIAEDAAVQMINVPSMEDRGIIEFCLLGLTTPIISASVTLPTSGASGPYPFVIDVFGYSGDGSLTLADWDSGILLTSFEYSGEESVVLDVTQAAMDAIFTGSSYAGLNLRCAGPSNIDRFRGMTSYLTFGLLENGSAAALSVVEAPEPDVCSLTFFGVLALLLMHRTGLRFRHR